MPTLGPAHSSSFNLRLQASPAHRQVSRPVAYQAACHPSHHFSVTNATRHAQRRSIPEPSRGPAREKPSRASVACAADGSYSRAQGLADSARPRQQQRDPAHGGPAQKRALGDPSVRDPKRSLEHHEAGVFREPGISKAATVEGVASIASSCKNWQQLNDVYHTYRGLMNPELVVFFLSRLARWQPDRERPMEDRSGKYPALQAFIVNLVGIGMRMLPYMGVHEAPAFISALGRLGYNSRCQEAEEVSTHCMALLSLFRTNDHFCLTASGLGRLGFDPGRTWIADFLDSTKPLLPTFNSLELANVVWALAKWQYLPGPAWMAVFFDRCEVVLQDPTSSGQGKQDKVNALVRMLWGLAMLKVALPPPLVEVILIESQVNFPKFDGPDLSSLSWALCRMDVTPPGFWIDDFLSFCRAKLRTFPMGICYTNTIWALSNWRATPSPEWLYDFCSSVAQFLPRLDARSLAVLLLGLADLGHQPEKPWVCLALEEFHKRHNDADAKTVVAVVWSLSRLLHGEPADAAFSAAEQQEGEEGEAEGASNSGQGEGSGRHGGGYKRWLTYYQALLQDLANVVSRGFKQLDANDLVDAAVGLADLGHYPGHSWLDRHEAYCNAKIMDFTAYQVRLLQSAVQALDDLQELPPLPRVV